MGFLNKNKGVSEQERANRVLFEKKLEDSKYRLSMFIDPFREGYRQLVLKYGIKFVPVMRFDQFKGITIGMAEQECREELEIIHKEKEEEQKAGGNGVIKN